MSVFLEFINNVALAAIVWGSVAGAGMMGLLGAYHIIQTPQEPQKPSWYRHEKSCRPAKIAKQ